MEIYVSDIKYDLP